MSTGLRNTVAIVAFVIALFWAMAHAPDSRGITTKQAVCKVFKSRCAPAWRVVMCESRGRARVVSRTNDVGLFQVNFSAHGWPGESFAQFRARMSDPIRNAKFAYKLSRGGTTWEAWRWSRHCHGLS